MVVAIGLMAECSATNWCFPTQEFNEHVKSCVLNVAGFVKTSFVRILLLTALQIVARFVEYSTLENSLPKFCMLYVEKTIPLYSFISTI